MGIDHLEYRDRAQSLDINDILLYTCIVESLDSSIFLSST